MKTITNTTVRPLRIPLPNKKVLHLGPRQSGHLSVHDVDHPPLKKLVEAGDVRIVDHGGNDAIPDPAQHGRVPFGD